MGWLGRRRMIRRTYQCSNCDREFTYECTSDDPDPLCPNPDCDKILEWRPQSFAIGGSHASKAVDLTQNIMEKDYGLTNFKDNARAGDTAIVPHHETRAETEKVEREFREQVAQRDDAKVAQFWGANAGTPTSLTSMTGQSMIAMAKAGPAGVDPISALQGQLKRSNVSRSPASMVKEGYATPFVNPAKK